MIKRGSITGAAITPPLFKGVGKMRVRDFQNLSLHGLIIFERALEKEIRKARKIIKQKKEDGEDYNYNRLDEQRLEKDLAIINRGWDMAQKQAVKDDA